MHRPFLHSLIKIRRSTLNQRLFTAKTEAQVPSSGVPAPGNPLYERDWCAR